LALNLIRQSKVQTRINIVISLSKKLLKTSINIQYAKVVYKENCWIFVYSAYEIHKLETYKMCLKLNKNSHIET